MKNSRNIPEEAKVVPEPRKNPGHDWQRFCGALRCDGDFLSVFALVGGDSALLIQNVMDDPRPGRESPQVAFDGFSRSIK